MRGLPSIIYFEKEELKMKNSKKTVLYLIVVMVIVSTVLAGCSKNSTKDEVSSTKGNMENQTNSTKTQEKGTDTGSSNTQKLPIVDKSLTLTYFSALHPTEAKILNSLDDNEAIKYLQEVTGIDIEFIHPPVGQEKEQFNIMIASNDLPDIVSGFFDSSYKGGVEAAINEGVLIKVNDLVEEYAVNFKENVLSDELFSKLVKSDDGTIVRFGGMMIPTLDGEKGRAYIGPILREDLLDDLKLDIPETIDEWYEILTAFRESGKVKIPMGWSHKGWDPTGDTFIGAYGINFDFSKDGNKVVYGPIDPRYKEFIKTFKKWYDEGLLDPDFATHNYFDNLTPMLLTGDIGSLGMHLWEYRTYHETIIDGEKSSATLVAAPLPVLKKGDKYNFADSYHGINGGKYITTACKHPIEAVKLIDYLYTPEMTRIMNWGIEGITYNMVEGKPQRSPEMEENHMEMTYRYTSMEFRGIVDWDQNDTQYPFPVQHQAWDLWSKASIQGKLPQGRTQTDEENAKYGSIMTEIEAYVDEMFLKFMMGLEPIEKFDEYVDQVKAMGIQEAIQIQQNTLDRYNAR